MIDHRIAMCEGEDTCLDPEVGRCTLDDDFEHVVELAEGAQAMLLAMPVYAGNVPAVLKIFRGGDVSYRHCAGRDFDRAPPRPPAGAGSPLRTTAGRCLA